MIISNSSTYSREEGGSYFVKARSADGVETAKEARSDAGSPAGGAGGLHGGGGERPGQQGQYPGHLRISDILTAPRETFYWREQSRH